MRLFLQVSVVLSLCVPRAQAQEPRRSALAVRTPRPPVIDGRLDEEVWQLAQPIGELVQVEPLEGVPPTETSDIRFLYDSDHLYIGVRCYDSRPDLIITTTRTRDALLEVDDRVEMVIDTYKDRRNAFFFQINAGGSKGDALITDNGSTFNKPWDGIWHAHTRTDAQGWTAEFELPFKTLNFDPLQSTWGFNLSRFIGRKREEARWSSARRDYRLFNIYQAGDIQGLEGIRQGIGLDVVPFFVSHWSNDRVGGSKTLSGEPGFDAFYKVIPSLTLSLTVNTDFAETEVDQRQINLTRFPLFFPERRDFFLQDSGQFEFGPSLAGNGRDTALIPFFSRRIGLLQGEEVPLLAGAKLTGRVDDYNIGLLDVQTDQVDVEDLGPVDSQNLFAGRIARNLGEQSTVGGILTRGDPTGAGDNLVYGLDLGYRTSSFLGDKSLVGSLYYLESDTEGVGGSDGAFGGGLRAPNDLWNWSLDFLEIQENFEAALGFVPRKDIRRYRSGVDFQPRPDVASIRQLEFGLSGVLFTDTRNDTETWEVELQPLGIEWESGEQLRFEVERVHDELDEDFEISDGVILPVGGYEWTRVRLELESAQERRLSAALSLEAGDFYDGRRSGYGAELLWQPGPLFNGGLAYQLDQVRLEEGDFDTQLARLRADFSFSPELSWNNFVQWDNESDSIGVQSRLRWIPVPEQEIFLVLNQTLEESGGRLDPLFQELSFKITYALRF